MTAVNPPCQLHPPRPWGVYLLTALAYLAAVLGILAAVLDFIGSRSTPTPQADPATWAASCHQALLHVPLEIAVALAFVALGTCLLLGFRWAYLISLSLASLALAGDLAYFICSLNEPQDAFRSPGSLDAWAAIMLFIPLAWMLLLHLVPAVRRFFTRPPPPPRGT
jgi:hypothetical protein